MGKTKSKMIRRTSKIFLDKGIKFEGDFEKNKKILGNNTLPSKKMRNRMAGLLVRLKKQEKKTE